MEKKNHFSVPAVGGTSLLVVFAVLCLTVFALLTLGTVQADCRLSDASVKAVTDYYAADLEAEKIYAQLRLGEIPAEVSVDGEFYTYSCPISDTQKLVVRLCREESAWKVLQWQAVSTVEWDTES
jgi:acyl-CoA synthetase (AMP-forming)/AMP-acid ligase II